MHKLNTFCMVMVLVAGVRLPAVASPPILVPELPPVTNGLVSAGPPQGYLPQEVNLPVSLFQETNRTFDTKICESVRKTTKPPVVISFPLITFFFSSPDTNDPVYSFCEMDQPDELVCTGTNVFRRPGPTNLIPVIRTSTVNTRKKEVTADLDLLIGVAPLNKPQDIQYFRRSFRFVFRHGWREE
jgi:hypothetical protein